MGIRDVQRKELAGKTKLTAVTLYVSPGKKMTRFVMLTHDSNGRAILPIAQLDRFLGWRNEGVTYTVG